MTLEEVKAKQEAGDELNAEEQAILDKGENGKGDDKGKEGEDQKFNVGGVEYTKDDQGNYCIGSIPVLDPQGIPWHHRGKEIDRVRADKADSDRKLAEALEKIKNPPVNEPQHDPNDIEPETGLTYGALAKIEARAEAKAKKLLGDESKRNLNINANTNITIQKHYLKGSPKYKSFFENPQYVKEMEAQLNSLSLESAMLPDIVEQAISLVLGKHIDDIYRAAEKKAKEDNEHHREIVGEVKLGKSAGAYAGKTVDITPEIEELAKDMGVSTEIAASSYYKRKARLDAKKK